MAALLVSCAGARPARPRSPYGLVLETTSGQRFDFGELHGKVALIHFFATWCFPCLIEVPTVDALQGLYGPKGFQAVGVGMDLEGARVLHPYVQSAGVRYPVLVADDEVRQGESPFGRILELPTTFVLDRKGKVVAAYAGPADPAKLEELIRDLLSR